MNTEELPIPSPYELSDEVEQLPRKVVLRHYRQPMQQMRDKGYSFREIAEYFAEKLVVEVNRNQVVYLLSEDPSVIENENKEDEEENELDHEDTQAYVAATNFTLPPPLMAPPPQAETAPTPVPSSKKTRKPKTKAKS